MPVILKIFFARLSENKSAFISYQFYNTTDTLWRNDNDSTNINRSKYRWKTLLKKSKERNNNNTSHASNNNSISRTRNNRGSRVWSNGEKSEMDVNVYTRVIRCSICPPCEPRAGNGRNTSVHCQINCTRFFRPVVSAQFSRSFER